MDLHFQLQGPSPGPSRTSLRNAVGDTGVRLITITGWWGWEVVE